MSSVSKRRILCWAIAAPTSWGRRCEAIGTQAPASAAATKVAAAATVLAQMRARATARRGTGLVVAGMLAAMLHRAGFARSEAAVDQHHTAVALQRRCRRERDQRVVRARELLARLQRRAVGRERVGADQQGAAQRRQCERD